MGVIYGVKDAGNLLMECEKTLPRNQHCELIAVPVLKEPKVEEKVVE